MLWVYGHYKYFNSFSARTDSRQILVERAREIVINMLVIVMWFVVQELGALVERAREIQQRDEVLDHTVADEAPSQQVSTYANLLKR